MSDKSLVDNKKRYKYDKLKGLIKEHFGTQADFCKALGLGTSTLASRLNGETFFDQTEIDKALELLGAKTSNDRDAIFFNRN